MTDRIVTALLDRHGRTYADEIGLAVDKGSPAPLFGLLCAALLFSARISADIAVAAAKALRRAGWTTADKMAAASWADRARTLNEAGYARYDERTSSMLGDTAELLAAEYGGDLRRLRDAADRDAAAERRLLKRFKGLGDVGVDIFFREVQVAWDEVHPFADRRALRAAGRLGLPDDVDALTALVARRDYACLVAALVRCDLAGDHDDIRLAAGEPGGAAEGSATKAELYARARGLDIPGRSRMSKNELAEAVAAREQS